MNCSFKNFDKLKRLTDLSLAINQCSVCPNLCHRTKVFSKSNGNVDSKILFVAEAPGRLGADRTGIPLYGDKTGDNFEKLISNAGLKREEVFITNAVLCNPRKNNGNNGTPTSDEIINCSSYLEMTINLVQPDIVIALGAIALNALSIIAPHSLTLSKDVGRFVYWNGITLIPLYHTGPRAMVHRRFSLQMEDFAMLKKLINADTGNKKRESIACCKNRKPFEQMIYAFVKSLGRITYFKLTKMLYFADLIALDRLGYTLSGEIYLRQLEGPWPPELKRAVRLLESHEVITTFVKHTPLVSLGPDQRINLTLNDKELDVLAEVIEKYGEMNNMMIKVAAYRTKPMRYIIVEEKKGKVMLNKPIIYKNKTIDNLDN